MRIGVSAWVIATLMAACPAAALNEGLQCVPYARALSGVEIRGDAHTWWNQADGQYARGKAPRVGAVMAFRPHGGMRLGHVAAVRKIIDSRTVLVSHANWSTINGVRGHIENDVRVVDASDANDWSRVKVWYTPNNALGTTEWPLHGFIYPAKPRGWGDSKAAVTTLLGYSPQNSTKPAAIPVAAIPVAATKAQAKSNANGAAARQPKASFTLSAALLAEIAKDAAKERKQGRAKG
jgi:surface antigen